MLRYLLKFIYLLMFLELISLLIPIYIGAYPEYLPFGRDPTSYLIIFVHIPSAWNMFAGYTITFIGSILFLAKNDVRYDRIAYTSTVLASLYGFVAVVTGMLWANEVWGSPWNWDPRETSTLILLLAYIGYIGLRGSIPDIDRRRVFSSVYGVAAYITLPITYLSAILFQSLHEQLPRQPLTSIMYPILGIRVIISFILFTLLIYLFYNVQKSREVG